MTDALAIVPRALTRKDLETLATHLGYTVEETAELYEEIIERSALPALEDEMEAVTLMIQRAESAEAALREARGHIDQLTGLLGIIKEHWIDYDHVFSTSVHDARQFLRHGVGE